MAEIKNWTTTAEVYYWLVKNFGVGQCSYFLSINRPWAIYYTSWGTIQVTFRNEADRNWFMLRWS